MKPRGRWISDSRIWLGLGVLAFCLVMPVYASKVHSAIAAREGTAYGIVTDQEPRRTFGYRYSYVFSVNGQSFTGWKSSWTNGVEFGTRVLVYYDSQNPNENALTDFAEMSRNPFTSLAHWSGDQKPHGWLIGGGFFAFLALVGTLTGEAVTRRGMVYRNGEPKTFWLVVGIEFLGGVLLIGLYLTS